MIAPKNISKLILLFITSLLLNCQLFSQENINYINKVYDKNIKTVLFYRTGWEFSYPVLELNSGKELMLEFDVLGDQYQDYSYTIIHCDSEWNPSGLNPLEFMSGFEDNPLQDYESSFNTLVDFTHYTLTVPNDDVKPLISGNYLLLIYEAYDKESPVLSRRFYVVENKTDIDADVRRSTIVNSLNDSQELEFIITDKSNIIFNPQDDLKLKVLQNNIPERSFTRTAPDFIKGNTFEYINPRENRIKGGNEFRYFNLKSTKYVTDRVFSIQFNDPYYIFKLLKEKSEAYLPYTFAQDINGEFLIVADKIDDPKLESDYVLVDFTYDYDFELANGSFYVYGALSSWECNELNRMEYNADRKAYQLRMLLKQGFYNYEYVFKESGSEKTDRSLSEGNHYETENNYLIFVYYTPQGSNYEQLIGFALINSLNRI